MKQKIRLLTIAVMFLFIVSAEKSLAAFWMNVGSAGFSSGEIKPHNIVTSSMNLSFNPETSEPYVAYEDATKANKITVMKYNGSSWTNVGLAGFSAAAVEDVSIDFNPETSEPYVAFHYLNSPQKAVVMKFNGENWVTVGLDGFSAGSAKGTNISFNPITNEPYVVYSDAINGLKATVMRYNGSSWVNVGSAGFSAGIAEYVYIAFNAAGDPYVTYQDSSVGYGETTVMKYNGSSWVNVGFPGFSANEVYGTSIAFNKATDEPYVLFEEYQANAKNKVVVMKYSGSSWVYVGTPFYKGGNNLLLSNLAFNPLTQEPYLVYVDPSVGSSKATVMKFNGVSWVTVGASGFSAGSAISPSLAFNPTTNEPYIFYVDSANSNKATVMKFFSAITGETCAGSLCNVYRFWSNAKQGHFYTMSKGEANNIIANDSSWTFEGQVYKSLNAQEANTTPIYRFWSASKQHHFFTKSESEKNNIIDNDPSWSYEGIAYYAYSSSQPNSTPIYRFWSNSKQGHFFTKSATEKNNIIANDPSWSYEGIAWYVPTN